MSEIGCRVSGASHWRRHSQPGAAPRYRRNSAQAPVDAGAYVYVAGEGVVFELGHPDADAQ
jgi:hypothetical protein